MRRGGIPAVVLLQAKREIFLCPTLVKPTERDARTKSNVYQPECDFRKMLKFEC